MHHFIYPTKATWISSGSSSGSRGTGTTPLSDPAAQNYGKDEILELKKEFYNLSFDYPTRILVQFDISDVAKTITDLQSTNEEIIPNTNPTVGSKFYLRLYEAEGNQELPSTYELTGHAITQDWDEGRGKFAAKPQVKDGASWNYRKWPEGGSGVSWYISGSSYASGNMQIASQSFSSTGSINGSTTGSTPDIEMDVTNIVIPWLSGSGATGTEALPLTTGSANYGLLLRFTGSQETDSTNFANLKFFSNNTNTIYSPKLEFRWDDHKPATGSNTGSLLQITSSGLVDNYIYPIGLRDSYKEDEKVKFRFGARKRYIQKTFNTSVQEVSGSFIPFNSGSYSIVDVATGETKVPFSTYTSMSCDATSNYFNQWLTGFETDRYYKILIKVKYDDKQEHIFDNDFEFKIKR